MMFCRAKTQTHACIGLYSTNTHTCQVGAASLLLVLFFKQQSVSLVMNRSPQVEEVTHPLFCLSPNRFCYRLIHKQSKKHSVSKNRHSSIDYLCAIPPGCFSSGARLWGKHCFQIKFALFNCYYDKVEVNIQPFCETVNTVYKWHISQSLFWVK